MTIGRSLCKTFIDTMHHIGMMLAENFTSNLSYFVPALPHLGLGRHAGMLKGNSCDFTQVPNASLELPHICALTPHLGHD